MKERNLSAPSVPAESEKLNNVIRNITDEIYFIEQRVLALPGMLACPRCWEGKLVVQHQEKSGDILLVCSRCGYSFGGFDTGPLKPFITDLYVDQEYNRTKESFAGFGLEADE